MGVSYDCIESDHCSHVLCFTEPAPEAVLCAGKMLIAPALLLPAKLRAGASCAGLTYVQLVRVVEYTEAGTQVWLCRVAAQSHYFDRRGYASTALFDSIMLGCATRYEFRRHGCMATVDLRDQVEDAATDALYKQQPSLPIAARDLVKTLAPLADQIGQEAPPMSAADMNPSGQEASAPAAYVHGPSVVVPIEVLREMGREELKRTRKCLSHRPALPVLLLSAVLEVLQEKREMAFMASLEWEISARSREMAQVKAVLRTWRRSWASVEVIAQYERGLSGALEACQVSLQLPEGRAA